MYPRKVKIPKSNSFFLLGPRGTGKTTLVRELSSQHPTLSINLLLAEHEDRLRLNPDHLIAMVKAAPQDTQYVVIDEIQKIPKLLDLVHHLIETTDLRFILTGSSARRLKLEGANLLAGRAIYRSLWPLTFDELGSDFSLENALAWGTLPAIFRHQTAEDRSDFLRTYAQQYLREEVWGEQFIRKLDPFRKFLEVAAQANGQIINYSNIARDAGVDDKTVRAYYEILEDTLMGFFLTSYEPSQRKTVYKSPKFYFFDVGVCRALSLSLGMIPMPGTFYFGRLFEHFVITEFVRQAQYLKPDYSFYYMRTKSDVELDLIIERPGQTKAVIEIKSTDTIREDQARKMEQFRDEFPDDEFFCISNTRTRFRFGDVTALHWQEAIRQILF